MTHDIDNLNILQGISYIVFSQQKKKNFEYFVYFRYAHQIQTEK